MSATVHFRGQMTPDHMVTSGAMKDAEGQKPGNTDRIDKTDQNWFSWMQNSGKSLKRIGADLSWSSQVLPCTSNHVLPG